MVDHMRRDTLMAGGALLVAAIAGASAAAADDLAAVHPELRDAARAWLAQHPGGRSLSLETLAAARRTAEAGYARSPGVPVERRRIPGRRGDPDVTIFLVNDRSGGHRPAILHTHGGGYVLGSAQGAMPRLQALAVALDCLIVSVDYRLAPETSYAGSTGDAYAALTWLHDHADGLGVDRTRIAVMGDSAGGGHAALLAITARDRGEVPIVFQSLTYPMLDDRTTMRTVRAPIGTIVWDAAANRFGWHAFLGQEPGGRDVPARAVPARARDLAGLPPAWIGVGGIDLFVDEDVDYARRLIAAGVPTELLVVPGAFHGFDNLAPQTAVATRFDAARTAALRQAFG